MFNGPWPSNPLSSPVPAVTWSRVLPALISRVGVREKRSQVVAHVHQVRTAASERKVRAAMPEDVHRVGRVRIGGPFEHADPVPERRAGGAVNHRVAPVEHQVAHVDDVRSLEGDYGVAARMGRAEVSRAYDFVTNRRLPGIGECLGREVVLGGLTLAPRRLLHVGRGGGMGDHTLGGILEDDVTARVIAMMMCVHEHVDGPHLRPLVDARQTQRSAVRKLTVDDDDSRRGDQVTDYAATAGEKADIATNPREYGRDRRCSRGARGLLPGACHDGPEHDAAQRGDGPTEKLTTSGGHLHETESITRVGHAARPAASRMALPLLLGHNAHLMTSELTAQATGPRSLSVVPDHIRRKVAIRVLPYVFLLYIVAFLDRVNVSYAALQMRSESWFNAEVLGFGAGIFFIGYLLLEIPSTVIVERWSARKWMSRIMISWGIIASAMGFVTSANQFYWGRFLLGLGEAGFFPGMIVYVSHWFTERDRAKGVAMFYTAVPLAYVIGSPLAGLLMRINWLGLEGWRWLFILEGIPAIVLGVLNLWLLTDWPREAKWLEPAEREQLQTAIDADRRDKPAHMSPIGFLTNPMILLLTLIYFLVNCGSYRLRHLAADDAEAAFGIVGHAGLASGRGAVRRGPRRRRRQRVVVRSVAGAGVARGDPDVHHGVRPGVRDVLSSHVDGLDHARLLHRRRRRLQLHSGVLGPAWFAADGHGRGGQRRHHQLVRQSRRVRWSVCDGMAEHQDPVVRGRNGRPLGGTGARRAAGADAAEVQKGQAGR